MTVVKLKPLHDRIVVKRENEEERSAGGIVIPDSAKEKPIRGKVLEVGKGKTLDSNQIRPLEVKIGDVVIFGKYAGTEIKLSGQDYLILKEDDVMAVVEE